MENFTPVMQLWILQLILCQLLVSQSAVMDHISIVACVLHHRQVQAHIVLQARPLVAQAG